MANCRRVGIEKFLFVGGSKKDLAARPFMDMTYGTVC